MNAASGFKFNRSQPEARRLMNNHLSTLLVGGSRSGKTFIIVRNIFVRAMRRRSRHLITRLRFNHAKTSLWYDTIPKVQELCWPQIKFGQNKNDWFITIPVDKAAGGGESQIWLGGLDDKERTEKVLGNEYATIYLNEASQISHSSAVILRTRLAQKTGLPLKEYIDCNPGAKKHWTHQEFIQGVIPGTTEPVKRDCGHLFMNPGDNAENLADGYMDILDSLPRRQRQRFLLGLYVDDVEGALWTDAMITDALSKRVGEMVQVVIAVDPAVTNQQGSDETGIVVCGKDEHGTGVVMADYSIKASTRKWAQRVVNAYHEHEANAVVVETNNGGDLLEDVLKNIDASIKIVKVHAAKGKFARAEPISSLYELGKVAHLKSLPELEAQLTEYVPLDSKQSPDRLDAVVWGLTHLMFRASGKIFLGAA